MYQLAKKVELRKTYKVTTTLDYAKEIKRQLTENGDTRNQKS